MTTKTKKPAASKKPTKKSPAAGKPPVGTGSPKLDRTLARAAAKEAKVPTAAQAPAASKGTLTRTSKALGKKPEGEPRLSVAPDDARIVATFTTPPGRPGSVVYRTRALFQTCKTVGAFREAARAADLDLGYLRTDERRGLIKLLPAAHLKEPKPKK